MRELAGSYWYGVYAWWRRAGLEPERAATATLASFTDWLTTQPPTAEDTAAARLREWIPARLAELAAHGVKLTGAAALEIDAAWAEARFAQEPAGEPEAIFQRRWALTVLEFSVAGLRSEYEGRGEEGLFGELLGFAGFGESGEEVYAAAAGRTGRSTSGMRKAVYDFRARQRALLHALAADTVADPADAESEITALLLACDAAGPQAAAAPLPSMLRSLRPEEVLARAMHSAKMSTAGAHGWTPPTIAETAALFPGYEMLSMLGRGGMGAVYQACQTSLDRLVAIKLLPLEVSVDRDFADRFRREARAMAKLNHPHIIAVYDFGQTSEGHLYFVMEFVEGANLHELIHRPDDPLPPGEALGLLEQVCDALAYAHGKGIVHRDIKPANVMVDREGRVKVADFGLARLTDAAGSEQWGSTMTGTIMGTPDYMSPEQKRGSHVDHRADIYALGVMLYEALCRETPQGAFQLPSKHGGLDKRLDLIVTRALASRPEDRFASTAEMKTAIELVRPAVTKAQAKKGPPKPAPAPPRTPLAPASTKSRAPLYSAASALVALLVLAAFFLSRDHRNRTPANQPAPAAAPLPEPWKNALAQPGFAGKADLELRGDGAVLTKKGGWLLENEAARDGAVRVRAPFTPALRLLRLIARRNGAAANYSLYLNDQANGVLALRALDGVYTSIPGLRHFFLPTPLHVGQPMEMELRVIGPKLIGRINGQIVLECEDPSIAAGKFGIVLQADERVELSAVEFLNLDAAGKPRAVAATGPAPNMAPVLSPLPPLPAKQTFDLIALLDPVQDRMFESKSVGANEWVRESGGRLVFTGGDGKAGKIAAPVSLSGARDYELTFAVANAPAFLRSMDVPFSANRQATFDFTPGGSISFRQQSEPDVLGPWPAGVAGTAPIALRVRSEADGKNAVIAVTVGDRPAGTWRGNIGGRGRTVEFHPAFPGEAEPALYAVSRREYTAWTLRVFDGEARLLRPAGNLQAGIWCKLLAEPENLRLWGGAVAGAGRLKLPTAGGAASKRRENSTRDGGVRIGAESFYFLVQAGLTYEGRPAGHSPQ